MTGPTFDFIPLTPEDAAAGMLDLSAQPAMKLFARSIAMQQAAGFGTMLDARQASCPVCAAPGFNDGWGGWNHACGAEIVGGEFAKECLGVRPAPDPSTPVRVQLKRTKGWRMPPNTIAATRPGRLGNPFTISAAMESGYVRTVQEAQSFVVDCFRDWIGPTQSGRNWWEGRESDKRKAAIMAALRGLRGKNLACFCKPGDPCHADVLIELANAPVSA